MFDLISNFLEAAFVLLQGYCLQFLYGNFLRPRFRRKQYTGVAVAMIYGAWKLGSSLLWHTDETMFLLLKLLLTICVLAVLVMCFYQAAKRVTIFLVLAFITVNEISFFLSYMLFQLASNLFELLNWLFLKGYFLDANAYMALIHATVLILQAGNYTFFLLILFLTLRSIVRNFREKEYPMHRTELLFLLAPNLVGLLICILLRTTIEMAENKAPKLLYDRYPLLTFIIPAILILSLLSILWDVKLFQDMISLSRERSSRIILEKQVYSMQAHMEEMERVYSGIRSMKHDMKNTLSVVMQLASRNPADQELQTYLSEFNKSMEQLQFRFKTGNSVADTLLNMKYHEIIRMIPDLQMYAEGLIFPDTLTIQSYDLGIILGNALDNAGQACKKLKEKEPAAETFIRLTSFKKGKFLFLKIENSFDGIIHKKETSEFPATDKKDKDAHGIGLINIQNTVEKYQGAVDWKVTDRVFTLSVMIKNT